MRDPGLGLTVAIGNGSGTKYDMIAIYEMVALFFSKKETITYVPNA